MRKLFLAAAILSFLVSCSGGSGSYVKTRSGFKAEAKSCSVEVQCFSPSIIRVVKYPADKVPDLSTSYSVVMKPEKARFSLEEKEGHVVMSTSEISLDLNLATGAVSFSDKEGRPIVREAENSLKFEPRMDAGKESFSISQGFLLDGKENIYGLGQHKGVGLNMRGKEIFLQNNNTEIAIPLVHSSKGYALYWDNYSTSRFSEKDGTMTFSSEIGDKAEYYLIKGDDADEVISGIRKLSGHVPLLPLWSYGFLQSKERYRGQDEIVGVVKRFRELGVPLDGIVQDWQYWGDNEHWNAMQFLNPSFSDPEKMVKEIHENNAHMLISVWPSFGPEAEIFKEFQEKGMLLPIDTYPGGGTRVYDAYDPAARDIYWSCMKRGLADAGVDGWWLDATEPEHKDAKPEDFEYVTSAGSFGRMRNAFPLYTVGGVYDHQRAEMPDKRVFILTRSAALGLQRFGAHCWSGDVRASWETLHDQIAEALSFSLTGLPYWNSDIGGFFVNGEFAPGIENPKYRKLYDRWMQFGVFCGLMRSHGTSTPREIFNFGSRGDKDFDIQEKCINLRYRLLPYIYSTAWDVTSNDGTLMRALFMDWPSDGSVRDVEDEFLFGKSLLVAPVTDSTDSRQIVLPSGEWIDFWNGDKLNGDVSFSFDCPEDIIPIFVKAGSIVPIGPTVQYASEKPWDSLQIRIYPGGDGTFTLYEDAGDGYEYEKGKYSTIDFEWNDESGELTIGKRHGKFPGMLKDRNFNVVLVGHGSGYGLDNESRDTVVHYVGNKVKINLR